MTSLTHLTGVGVTRMMVVIALLICQSAAKVETLRAAPVVEPVGGSVPAAVEPPHPHVAWALERFATAGLEPPTETDVRLHDDLGDCNGHRGRFRIEERRVDVCVTADDPVIHRRLQRRVLLHEFAHVWTVDHLDASARDEFIALRGLAGWNDQNDEWRDRGVEQVAEIVAVALWDQGPWMSRIHDNSCNDIMAAFDVLTGLAPVNPDLECVHEHLHHHRGRRPKAAVQTSP